MLTTYQHNGIPRGIRAGRAWAADNCAYTGFDAGRFFAWLPELVSYRATCLFVAVPDVVEDAAATLAQYGAYAPRLAGWPLAYVAQDGSEHLPIPDGASALFVGGSTAWKESEAAASVIRRAQGMGLHIHIGRVNWRRRYDLFRAMPGSEGWTCDGTRIRFEGVERTLKAWKQYMDQPPVEAVQGRLFTPG